MDTIQELNTNTGYILEKTIAQEATLKDTRRQLQLLQHKYSMVDHELDAHKRELALHINDNQCAWKTLDTLLFENSKSSAAKFLLEAKREGLTGEQFAQQIKEWLANGMLRVEWEPATQNAPVDRREVELELQELRNEVRLLRDQLQECKGSFRVMCRLKPDRDPCVKVSNAAGTEVEIMSTQVCGQLLDRTACKC